ncbi:MAG: carboxymuconolactone decarboxylase family protein [Gemmataceae bacterium]
MTTSWLTSIVLALAAPPAVQEAPKPAPGNRVVQKEALEAHKQARPRLPMPPEPKEEGTPSRVNNGRFRSYYLPDFRDAMGNPPMPPGGAAAGGAGGNRVQDPAMTLDNTFKVKLFWISSRANNCYYCLGHQEHKLLAAGLTDDEIALLDGHWKDAPAEAQAAYRFTKKLTANLAEWTPEETTKLSKHYKPVQVAEIIVTVAGYNSTNRWTDGLNIPAEADAAFFRKGESKANFSTFLSKTSAPYADLASTVAPQVNPQAKSTTWPEEQIRQEWSRLAKAQPLLPLKDGAGPHWKQFLNTFPRQGASRITAYEALSTKGKLPQNVRHAIAWAAAREDRAGYAFHHACERLRQEGWSEANLMGRVDDCPKLSAREKDAVRLAAKLAATPYLVSDRDIENLRKEWTDFEVAEIVHHGCQAAFFHRVTIAANLPLEAK